DPDIGDVLTLGVTRDDGSPLPAWLSFDPATASFSGTPPADFAPTATELRMTVRATDSGGESAATSLVLVVAPDDSTGDVNYRLLDTQTEAAEGEEPRRSLVEDDGPILTGDALRLLFEDTGGGTNIAQVFQGRGDLTEGTGFVPEDREEEESELDELNLIFRDGDWYIVDPAAEGGLRLYAPPAEQADPDAGEGGELPPGAQAFSRQLVDIADAFDRRAAALDLALFSHSQNV
ncbi:MAG TPA: putative Ig domain-containing protein, partial [Saliniramus sp.]|nr:putative Ig domain-containing protein [Saliniramus sp.]